MEKQGLLHMVKKDDKKKKRQKRNTETKQQEAVAQLGSVLICITQTNSIHHKICKTVQEMHIGCLSTV